MEFGPQHGIQGDYGTELPETKVEEQDLAVERSAARFSKSKEFKALKEHLEARIADYQTRLPSGKSVLEATVEDWKVANLVIAELRAILDFYENAQQVVREADAKR